MKGKHPKSVVTIAITLVCACGVLLTSGCVSFPTYEVAIDSFSAGSQAGKRYVLHPAANTLPANDLQFQEFAAHTHRVLQQQGFKLAEDVGTADIAIFLAFSISGPLVNQYTYSTPIQGQIGTSTSYSSGSVQTSPNTWQSSIQQNDKPIYGTVAYQQHVGTYTTFTRQIVLQAVDLKTQYASQPPRQVWKTTILSTGSSGDFRRVFPIMLGAAAQFIGTNTGHQVELRLKEDDHRITKLGLGTQMSAPKPPTFAR